jgi:hypothetical protein
MSSSLEHPLKEHANGPAGPEHAPQEHADSPAGPPPPELAPDLTVVLDPTPDATRVMDPVPAPSDDHAVRDDHSVRDDRAAQGERAVVEPLPPIRLAPAPPPPVSFPPRPADPALATQPPPPPRRPGLGVLAGAAAAVVVVGGVAVAGLRSSGGGEDRTAPAGSSARGSAVAVAADTVRASASSTQRRDGSITYGAANTLDGRPETAWNSNGQGAGASLTYTFAAPVDLASITVLNGYQKVRTASNGSTVDLFALNERVQTLRVVTDAGSTEWTLRDDRSPQTLSRAFGRTRTVRLQVVSTYPSSRYRDLGVSEVRFTARG